MGPSSAELSPNRQRTDFRWTYRPAWARVSAMSRDELVGAYLDGRISRRTLIRRLVAAGVTTGAAVAYAQMLAPERAEAGATANDHYPLVDLRITSKTLDKVRQQKQVTVKLTSSEEVKDLYIRALLKSSGSGVPIGAKFVETFLGGAGSKQVAIPIDRSMLAGRKSVRIYVQATGRDNENFRIIASTAKTLK
jgi:hypothetical protein